MQNRTPTKGQIKWDGNSIFDATKSSFRANVGVMFQQTMILQGSIYQNITFGMDSTLREVKEAATAAEIADVIDELPNGYDTVLGGGSVNLSGGQLQRICLARVLLRKCSLLLLDEGKFLHIALLILDVSMLTSPS
jgi:ABC-type multidrug transport system fused ATPase/permease subunit